MPRRRPGLWAAIGLNLALLTVAVSVLDAGVFFLVTRRMLSENAVDLAMSSADIVTEQLVGVGPDGWKRVIDAHRRAGTRELTLYAQSGEILAGEHVVADQSVRTAFFARESVVDAGDGGVQVLAPVGRPGPPQAGGPEGDH